MYLHRDSFMNRLSQLVVIMRCPAVATHDPCDRVPEVLELVPALCVLEVLADF